MYKRVEVKRGYIEYLCADKPQERDGLMDVGLLILESGDSFTLNEEKKEYAALLFEGEVTFTWNGKTVTAQRDNPFDCGPWCFHAPAGVALTIQAKEHSEVYVQKTENTNTFEPKLYSPQDTHTQRAGEGNVLDGAMRRNIRTIFDYDNAPYSCMVLGEVVNFPGRWSSYPPHSHPQPEVYFYRFDKPQGFGVGFINGNPVKIEHNGISLITEKSHAHCAAPGYVLCYAWGIRHLDGNPWRKTRIDDPEHSWLTQADAKIWHEKTE